MGSCIKGALHIDMDKKIFLLVSSIIAICFIFVACGDDNMNGITDIHDLISEGEPPDLLVEGRQLLLNGQPFAITIKGVSYSPIPIGGAFDDGNNLGDVFSNKGTDAFFEPVWQRDVPLMQEMGVNTVRIYSMWPWDPFWQGSGQFSPDPPPQGSNHFRSHKKFLDLIYNNGQQGLICAFVAYPVRSETFTYEAAPDAQPGDKDIVVTSDGTKFRRTGNQEVRDQDRALYKALVEQLKDHPAVWGFVIGNELNNDIRRSDPQFWDFIDSIAEDIKQIAPKKETMITLLDDSMMTIPLAKQLGPSKCKLEDGTITDQTCKSDSDCTMLNSTCEEMPNIDIWGINSFRGTVNTGFDILFANYQKASSKPLIISEFGPSASTRSSGSCATGEIVELPDKAQEQADYIESHWKDILRSTADTMIGEILPPSQVAAGGIIFEWHDEWWKAGSPGMHDPGKNINAAFPGGCQDEEWFGINGLDLQRDSPFDFPSPFVPDKLEQRAAFNTLKGLWTSN